jgi:hypothetical protein
MELTGVLFDIMPAQGGTGKTGNAWKKQEFLIEFGTGQYPKKVLMAVWNDKIDFNTYQKGQQVKVYFDIEAREYNGRWYNDVKAWKMEPANGGGAAAGGADVPPYTPPPPAYDDNLSAQDDLPF